MNFKLKKKIRKSLSFYSENHFVRSVKIGAIFTRVISLSKIRIKSRRKIKDELKIGRDDSFDEELS